MFGVSNETLVHLFLDKFMLGILPKDGDRVIKDITLTGTDGTNILIKKNTNTIYKELPRKVFETVPDKSVLFIFYFPVGTKTSPDSRQFTTPDKSVYTFSTGDGVQKNNETYEKVVTEGTIQIKPPIEDNMIGNSSSSFIDSATLQESSLGGTPIFDDFKDNPFYKVGVILLKVLKDLFIVTIFWLIFLSITCWLNVPSTYLYPTDISKYPFIFFGGGEDGYYDYTTTDKEKRLCKMIEVPDVLSRETQQDEFFEELNKIKYPDKEILNTIYPEFLSRNDTSVNWFGKQLMDKCDKDHLSTIDYFIYIIQLIAFQNFLYCSQTLELIHRIFSFFSKEILGVISPLKVPYLGIPVISIIFAFLLYSLFLNSDFLKEKLVELFKIKLSEGKDEKSIILNHFLHFLISILSCSMIVFIPLFSLLLIVCLGITSVVLIKNLFSPYNTPIWIFSFILLISALTTGTTTGLVLSGVMPFKDFFISTGVSGLPSLFSIGIPLLGALSYSGYISLKIFTSFFKFIKLDFMKAMMNNTFPSLILLSFLFLIFHVNEMLGKTYMVTTIVIILLMGLIRLLMVNKSN